jgi:hypothetical protein
MSWCSLPLRRPWDHQRAARRSRAISRSLARRLERRQEGDLRRRIESVRSRRFPCCVTKRVRVDRSGDEQQAADVRPHAVCQKPPTAARNHRASFGYIASQEGTLIVRHRRGFKVGSSSVWEHHASCSDAVLDCRLRPLSPRPKNALCRAPHALALARAQRLIRSASRGRNRSQPYPDRWQPDPEAPRG